MIIAKIRKRKEKLIIYDKIPAILIKNSSNIMIKIDNNKINYNFIKKGFTYKLKLFNKIYEILTTDINYHPYKKIILHIDLKVINDKI